MYDSIDDQIPQRGVFARVGVYFVNALVWKAFWVHGHAEEKSIEDGVAHGIYVEAACEGENFCAKKKNMLRRCCNAQVWVVERAGVEECDEHFEVRWGFDGESED
jgi:hypothetical protein